MAKSKIIFVCQQCGASAPKWMGKCPACNSWNSLVEEVSVAQTATTDRALNSIKRKGSQSIAITEVDGQKVNRILLSDNELNRVLGGGLVPGSVILLGGEPGIGKSTILLKLGLENPSLDILYVSGEESLEQIKLRAERIGNPTDNLKVTTDTQLEMLLNTAELDQPDLLIIDSIQTISSIKLDAAPGTVSQIRDCTAEIIKIAKKRNIAVILVGHITKDGSIAGPKLLEHMVDTVLYFEGDRHYTYRIMRTMKNRFGSIAELGLYEMTDMGLTEVTNPSEMLLTLRQDPISGIAISCMLEGNRNFLIEIQSLISSSAYGTPQRNSNGYDAKRMNMILAVLEKRCRITLGMADVFVNIAGGLRPEDPAIDLAVAIAMVSSYLDQPVGTDYCFAGELGLSGEIRPVSRIDQRLAEAEKLGFKYACISSYNLKSINNKFQKIKIIHAHQLSDLLYQIFEL
ncbi:MAG: DNA repair protein RadA [Bacteroidota bacterium]|nr:DNA repair protein RadA [Bacteroidota bacterium]